MDPITINKEKLKKRSWTQDMLIAAMIVHNEINVDEGINKLLQYELINDGKLNKNAIAIVNNYWNDILVHSSDKDIKELASTLKSMWPKGIKPGTNTPWAEAERLIIDRIKDFKSRFDKDGKYDNDQILSAARMYVNKMSGQKTMRVLRYFMFKKDDDGSFKSDLLNILEDPVYLNEVSSNDEDYGDCLF